MVAWILGFFSIFAAANVVYATSLWFELGPSATVVLNLIGFEFGMPVYVYMLISVFATLAFLGGTTHALVSELSVEDQIKTVNEKANRLQAGQESQQKVLESVQARVFLVDESLERTRKELSKGIVDQGDSIKQNLELNHQSQQKVLDAMQGRVFLLDEDMKSLKKGLKDQSIAVRAVGANLVELAILAKQKGEIDDIKAKLEQLEGTLIMPKALLTSKSDVEDVKGIGPLKATELKEIGIASVGDLVMADPKIITEKTGASENTVAKWQGRAQLSLVPGLKDKDMFLLGELDIIDRKDLAEQETIELSKKLNAIFKVNLAKGKVAEDDKPTIEEIDSWIKFVKS